MASSGTCEGCGSQCVTFDVGTGVFACEECGLVRDDTVFRHVDFDDEGTRIGTYVGGRGTVSTLGLGRSAWSLAPGSRIGFRSERGKRYVNDKLDELACLLRLPKDKVEDVKHMLGVITEEKWSARQWMDVLIATCIYIVARKHGLPLSAAEVAATLNCAVKDILRAYQRVRHHLDFQSPLLDPAAYFDKVLSHHPSFMAMEKQTLRRLSRHGHCLLWYGSEWSLAAGRHPLALVAAVVALVGKANNVKVDLNTVSKELHVNPATSRLRLKEYMNSLVGFAQLLPWGKDITLKTVSRHLPFLLQYLETRVKMDSGNVAETSQVLGKLKKTSAAEDAALCRIAKALCLKYGPKISSVLDSQPFEVVKDEEPDLLPVHQVVSITKKQKVDNDANFANDSIICCGASKQAKKESNSTSSMRVTALQAISHVENGEKTADQSTWKPFPPSFLANKEATVKRIVKIDAAKQRIARIKQDMTNQLASEENEGIIDEQFSQAKNLDPTASGLRAGGAKAPDALLDDEDFLIQYCLLRGAQEDLLEAGYYKHVLSTSPVQQVPEIMSDEDLLVYFKTPREIEFLQSVSQGDYLCPWLTTEEMELQGL